MSQWFARCYTNRLDVNSKNHQNTLKLLAQGKILRASKNVWKILQIILWAFLHIWWNIVSRIRFWKESSNGSSRRAKNSWTPSHQKYDQVIIKRTIVLVLGLSTALHRSFLERCTLTDKAVWTIWRGFSKHHQRWQGPDHPPL